MIEKQEKEEKGERETEGWGGEGEKNKDEEEEEGGREAERMSRSPQTAVSRSRGALDGQQQKKIQSPEKQIAM